LGEGEFAQMKWNSPSPRGDNSGRVKIHRNSLKILYSRSSEPNSTKLGTNYIPGLENSSVFK
jgi:hypothetical protein